MLIRERTVLKGSTTLIHMHKERFAPFLLYSRIPKIISLLLNSGTAGAAQLLRRACCRPGWPEATGIVPDAGQKDEGCGSSYHTVSSNSLGFFLLVLLIKCVYVKGAGLLHPHVAVPCLGWQGNLVLLQVGLPGQATPEAPVTADQGSEVRVMQTFLLL